MAVTLVTPLTVLKTNQEAKDLPLSELFKNFEERNGTLTIQLNYFQTISHSTLSEIPVQ